MGNKRIVIFIAVLVTCVLAGGGYAAYVSTRDGENTEVIDLGAVPNDAIVVSNAGLAQEDRRTGWLDAEGQKHLTNLKCDRVHFSQGKGICLAVNEKRTGFVTRFLDSHLQVTHETNAAGVPSRARVSHDGRIASTTVFVLGHSYAEGTFSTETSLWDMETQRRITDLEQFSTFLDGNRIDAIDMNYWGVTFDPTDSNFFYATLGTQGHTYLIRGDIRAKTAQVLRDGVECPSLSPDGKRIAYKHKERDGFWKIHVMNVSDLKDRPVGEDRPIDDQVEWLDNDRVAYSLVNDDLYAVSTVNGGPALLTEDARSPAAAATK